MNDINQDEYRGKTADVLPEGSVFLGAVMPSDFPRIYRVRIGAAIPLRANGDESIAKTPHAASIYTIHTVLKLGKLRPKTLADEEPGVAWEHPNGVIFWRGDLDELVLLKKNGVPVHAFGSASKCELPPDWKCRGKVKVTFEGDTQ